MTRISLIDDFNHPELRGLIETLRNGRGGALLDLYRVLLHSPAIAKSWFEQSNAVRWQTTLDGRLRELIIVRVALIHQASYVLTQHVPVLAAAEGVSETECEALAKWEQSSLFSERERAALAYTDAITMHASVSDETFEVVTRRFTERQIAEMTVLISFFNMATRFTNALQITPAAGKTRERDSSSNRHSEKFSLRHDTRPVIVVQNDRFLRLIGTILDPESSKEFVPAYSDYFAHDIPDFEGFCAKLRIDASGLYPARIVLVTTTQELHARLPLADAFITESLPFGEPELELSGRLRLVYKFGAVPKGIDTAACTRRGVKVLTIRRRSSAACAEVAIALMLSLAKKLQRLSGRITSEQLEDEGGQYRSFDLRYTPNANWARVPGIRTLNGATLGIIGIGEIGREIVLRLAPFGMRIVYFQRSRLSREEEVALGVAYEPLERLLAESDWIIPQLPGSEKTRHFLGPQQFDQMKNGACLINIARADIVDRDALIVALQSGRLGGFALDPLYEEPGKADDALLAYRNVVLLPHIAAQPRSNFLLDMSDMITTMSRELTE